MPRKRRPKILTLAILTTLTILTWVSFEVWRSFTTHAPTPVDSQTIKPLDPSLDTKTLEKLKGQTYLPDSEARRGAAGVVITTPIPTETPVQPTASPTTQPATTPTPTTAAGGSQ